MKLFLWNAIYPSSYAEFFLKVMDRGISSIFHGNQLPCMSNLIEEYSS